MRLIDADGTIEKLKNTLNMLEEDLTETRSLSEESPNNPYNDWKSQIETLERNIRTCKAKIKALDDAPTAYDVDKVVERMESEIEIKVTQYPLHGRYIKKNRAIEIVKAGGVDE